MREIEIEIEAREKARARENTHTHTHTHTHVYTCIHILIQTIPCPQHAVVSLAYTPVWKVTASVRGFLFAVLTAPALSEVSSASPGRTALGRASHLSKVGRGRAAPVKVPYFVEGKAGDKASGFQCTRLNFFLLFLPKNPFLVCFAGVQTTARTGVSREIAGYEHSQDF